MSVKVLNVSLVTPFQSFFEGEVASLQLPLWNGMIGVFPDHSPMLAVIGFGPCTLKLPDGSIESFVLDAGFLEIEHNKVTILAGGADYVSDIKVEKEQKALAAAEALPVHSQEDREIKEDRVRAAKARIKLAGG
ncbi:MAG: ATP synthase F1 subunit epsilon [Leptospirales bacterium]|nr:ATP synthase F1 subunit epsilon [Leptospirales bacterium]